MAGWRDNVIDHETSRAVIGGIAAGIAVNLKYLSARIGPKIRANLPRYGTILGRFTGRCLRAYRSKRHNGSASRIDG